VNSCFRLSPLRDHEENGVVDDGEDGDDGARDRLLSLCFSEGFGGMVVVGVADVGRGSRSRGTRNA
jgi:hypothetical protein